MVRKVAIVGRAPTARLAPFFDPEWEIWGLAWVTYPREDRTFDPHRFPDSYSEVELPAFWRDCFPRAEAKHIPVECDLSNPYTNKKPFPFEGVFASCGGPYFESSIAYMLGLALFEAVEEVGIWGVHMEQASEYADQRPNLEYLIGFCRGRGMKVTVCPGAPLLMSAWSAGRYGLSPEHRFRR